MTQWIKSLFDRSSIVCTISNEVRDDLQTEKLLQLASTRLPARSYYIMIHVVYNNNVSGNSIDEPYGANHARGRQNK